MSERENVSVVDCARKRAVYQGRVQGVGFRYTTISIARRFPVVGYVKNLRDGSVEVLASGRSEDVREFFEAVSSAFSKYVTGCSVDEDRSGENYVQFEIRY